MQSDQRKLPNDHSHGRSHKPGFDAVSAPGRGHSRKSGHDHSHDHGVPVSHDGLNRRFLIGIALNLVFVGVEATYGFISGSMALLADAGHNLSDAFGLVLGLVAVRLINVKSTERFTFGYGRASILLAIVNGMLLLGASGAIAWEAVTRIQTPAPVPGNVIMIVAAIGLLINTASSLLYLKGSQSDLNLRGAFLHMAADALVSLAVVAGGLAIQFSGLAIIDPILSLVVVMVIVYSAAGLLREASRLALDAVPGHIDIRAVERTLNEIENVSDVHDLHIWATSTASVALSAHAVMPGVRSRETKKTLVAARARLAEEFGIHHVALQVEPEASASCRCVYG